MCTLICTSNYGFKYCSFGRDTWVDDERNISQVYPWDCLNRENNIHEMRQQDTFVSKNFEFESRTPFHQNDNALHFIRDTVNLKEFHLGQKINILLKPISQLSNDLDTCYKNLIYRGQDEELEEND